LAGCAEDVSVRFRRYEFPAAAIEAMSKQASRRAALIVVILIAMGFGAVVLASPNHLANLYLIPAFTVFAGFLAWKQSAAAAQNTRNMFESTVFEVFEDGVTGRTLVSEVTIEWGEVKAMELLSQGIRLRGPEAGQVLLMRKELAGFGGLAAQLEEGVPAHVERKAAASEMGPYPILIGSGALMIAAMTVNTAPFAMPLNLIAAVVFGGCMIAGLRSTAMPKELKRKMWVTLLPVGALLYRAYLLA
jgi:hypothetical protein